MSEQLERAATTEAGRGDEFPVVTLVETEHYCIQHHDQLVALPTPEVGEVSPEVGEVSARDPPHPICRKCVISAALGTPPEVKRYFADFLKRGISAKYLEQFLGILRINDLSVDENTQIIICLLYIAALNNTQPQKIAADMVEREAEFRNSQTPQYRPHMH